MEHGLWYLTWAQELRAAADAVHDNDTRRELLFMAQAYERLARKHGKPAVPRGEKGRARPI